ncbi:MAG TPA: hypothetical protein VK002_09100 [Rubricoccaceae bacterium]|nr:hypothetical protein [Rubricoccaceae bacterium]
MLPLVPVLVFALTLGGTPVEVAVHDAGPGLALLVLHDDENTAVEAGQAFVEAHGGRLVELRAQGERRVAFTLDGRAFSVDPNRIFTDAGVRRTLEADSAHAGAVALARLFGDALVAVYAPDAFVVTLHNNTPGDYSALSYAEGGAYARDAEAIHLEDGADPDDFFFVTERALFDILAAGGFNVVLQDNRGVTDDGSLSVWAARAGLPYVNVEAEHGHLEAQLRMLEAVARVLAYDTPAEGE